MPTRGFRSLRGRTLVERGGALYWFRLILSTGFSPVRRFFFFTVSGEALRRAAVANDERAFTERRLGCQENFTEK
jgi:hypothetical protein